MDQVASNNSPSMLTDIDCRRQLKIMQTESNFANGPSNAPRMDSFLNRPSKFIFNPSQENCAIPTPSSALPYFPTSRNNYSENHLISNMYIPKMPESFLENEPLLKPAAAFHYPPVKNGQTKEIPSLFEDLEMPSFSNSFFPYNKDHHLLNKENSLEYDGISQKSNGSSPHNTSNGSSSEEPEFAFKSQSSDDFNQNLTSVNKKMKKRELFFLDKNEMPATASSSGAYFESFFNSCQPVKRKKDIEVQHDDHCLLSVYEFYQNWPSVFRKRIFADEDGDYLFEIHPQDKNLDYDKSKFSLMMRYTSRTGLKRNVNFACSILNVDDEAVFTWDMEEFLETSNDLVVGYLHVAGLADLSRKSYVWNQDLIKFKINLRVKLETKG